MSKIWTFIVSIGLFVSCTDKRAGEKRGLGKILNAESKDAIASKDGTASKDAASSKPEDKKIASVPKSTVTDSQGDTENSGGAGAVTPNCKGDQESCELTGISSFKLLDFANQYRPIIVQNNGDLWAQKDNVPLAGSDKKDDNQPLAKDYNLFGAGVVSVQIDENNTAVKNSKDEVLLKVGVNGTWAKIGDSVESFVLTGQRVVMLNKQKKLYGHDILSVQTALLTEKVKSFSAKSNQIGVIIEDGTFWVKSGGLFAPWSLVNLPAKAVKGLVGFGKFAVLLEDGKLFASSWVPEDSYKVQIGSPIALSVIDFAMSKNYFAALTETGIYLKPGLQGDWVKENQEAAKDNVVYLTDYVIATRTKEAKLFARALPSGTWKLAAENVAATFINKNYISIVNNKGEALAKDVDATAWWNAKTLASDVPVIQNVPKTCQNAFFAGNPFEGDCGMRDVVQADVAFISGQPRSLVLFKNGDLFGLKDGNSLSGAPNYDLLASGMKSFQAGYNRLVVLDSANNIFYKTGLYGAWVPAGSGVLNYQLAGDWLIMLDYNARLYAFDFRTNTGGAIGDSVYQYGAGDYMVAAVTNDNKLWIKASFLNAPWSSVQLNEPVKKVVVKGARVVVLLASGKLLMSYGRPSDGSAAKVTEIGSDLDDFEMSHQYYAGLTFGGQVLLKKGYDGAWNADGGVGVYNKIYLSDDILAVRSNDKMLYAREMTGTWGPMRAKAESVKFTGRFISVVSTESFLYQKEFIAGQWWTSNPPPQGFGFHAMRNFNKLMGVATFSWQAQNDQSAINILKNNYTSVTPENELKFSYTEPSRGVYSLDAARGVLDFARKNDMKIHGHVLIWHHDSQLPDWLRAYQNNPAELANILYAHAYNIVLKLTDEYGDRLASIDVVNEAVDDWGGMRASIWKPIGNGYNDYIKLAFAAARAANPNVKLHYNDYLAEGYTNKSNVVYGMVADLKGAGTPIDGVGLQMHRSPGWPFTQGNIEGNVWRLGQLGLEVHVSEMDYAVADSQPNGGAEFGNQSWFFYQITKMCMWSPVCNKVTFWGVFDKASWIPWATPGYGRGLPFDDFYQPKYGFNGTLDATMGK